MLTDPLRQLPAPALDALASYLDQLARAAGALAETKSRRQERRAYQARKAARVMAGELVAQLVNQIGIRSAVAQVALETGLPQETVAANWRVRERRRAARARWARNREIMRRAALGHTNAEIGAALGLHPGSVSRIVQAQLRQARAAPPAHGPARSAHNRGRAASE